MASLSGDRTVSPNMVNRISKFLNFYRISLKTEVCKRLVFQKKTKKKQKKQANVDTKTYSAAGDMA